MDKDALELKGFKISSAGSVLIESANLEVLNKLLNKKGCGLCLAKWNQVTLHLGTGLMHSCHHPVPHKIPLEELKDNPAALFNTKHLKNARKQMLNGEKPSECDYCWRIEENGDTSDRLYKSIEPWALPSYDRVVASTGDEDVFPSYLEVDFSNVCNMKCVYCGPEFSSKWVSELKQKGPMKLMEGTPDETWAQGWQDLDSLSYKQSEENPYVTAFWEWFPEAYTHLKEYRITGGEPLMSKETFRSIDWLIANPNPELQFSMNSNLCVPDKIWDKFIDKLEILKSNNTIKKATIYISAESWGEAAEYARTDMDFELFKARAEQLAEIGNVRIVVMAAFNVLAITTFKTLLEWVLELKKKYNPNSIVVNDETKTGYKIAGSDFKDRAEKNPSLVDSYAIGIDIPYVRHPTHLDAQYCSDDLVEDYMLPALDFMSNNVAWSAYNGHQGFEAHEVDKLKRIIYHRIYFNPKNNPRTEDKKIKQQRALFYEFVEVLDARRNTDFLAVFPEMKEFYEICKNEKLQVDAKHNK